MKKHIKDHTLPEVKCPKCDKVFKNKGLLQCHDKNTHQRSERFECPICPDQVFHRKDILKDHCMYHHIKIKPFVCNTCGADFWQKLNLGAHIAEAHENWPKDKAKKEWSNLLKENPHLFKQIPIINHFKRLIGEPINEDCKT